MNDQPRSPEERDDIATLVRLAGKRHPVPPERARRAREAAHASWQSNLRVRSGRRRIGYAIGAVAAALVALAAFRVLVVEPGPGAASMVAVVEAVDGASWSRKATSGNTERVFPLRVGDRVPIGDELTTGPGGGAALRLAGGHSLRLDGSTRARWTDAMTFTLDHGALYVDSGGDASPGTDVEIRTALGVVREIGTQFEVRLDADGMRVRLREGAVEFASGAVVERVVAGHELRVGRDGSVVRGTIAVHGAGWQWIADRTPMIALEGRSARSFLDWVARERGWRLAFADQRVAASADEIVLGGTAGDLDLDDALDAVLPTCRMTHRVEDGTLVIDEMRLP